MNIQNNFNITTLINHFDKTYVQCYNGYSERKEIKGVLEVNVNLKGFKIDKAELKDALNCLKNANDYRSVLHYELRQNSDLTEDYKQDYDEQLRIIRYWNALAYQIILKELSEQAEKEVQEILHLEMEREISERWE